MIPLVLFTGALKRRRGRGPQNLNRRFMRKNIIYIGLLLLLFAQPCLAGHYPVLKVVDSDTIDVNYNGTKERIRLLCVDTPESVHPDQSKNTAMGRKASDYTKKRLTGQSIELEFETKIRGKYGRLLAWPMSSWTGKILTWNWSGRDCPLITPNTGIASTTMLNSYQTRRMPGHKD